jgi:hypothetical protein
MTITTLTARSDKTQRCFTPAPQSIPHQPYTRPMFRSLTRCVLAASAWLAPYSHHAGAQSPLVRFGAEVSPEVRLTYERGLRYLASEQQEDGSWSGRQIGSGITGLCLMAFLAHGEDPNFGSHSVNIRNAARSIILSQDVSTGYIPNSMYHHGFAMLALAESYGSVDEAVLWDQRVPINKQRSIGAALQLAVRCAVTAQKENPWGGWRYSPTSNDADTSVSGAVLMGLLAARNAGIEVPDESIDKAISYYKQCTSNSGQVSYSGGLGGFGESIARISIASLVYSVARRKDLPQSKATLSYLTQRLESPPNSYPEYTRYYQAQALFQGDVEAWKKWNKSLIRQLKKAQLKDGSFQGQFGQTTGTSMSLLALALNYRFLPIYER